MNAPLSASGVIASPPSPSRLVRPSGTGSEGGRSLVVIMYRKRTCKMMESVCEREEVGEEEHFGAYENIMMGHDDSA